MSSHTFPLIAAQVDDQVGMPPNSVNKCDVFKSELAGLYTEGGRVDLDKVASVVQKYSGTKIPLKKTSDSLRVCGQDDTVYGGSEELLEAWKDFYLPERMEMVVIGAIDRFHFVTFGQQLVLLLCEDGKIFTYEDEEEELHLVARNVNELFETGLTFPGLECYKMGECFEDDTEEEEDDEIMKSDEEKKEEQEYLDFYESMWSKVRELCGYSKH